MEIKDGGVLRTGDIEPRSMSSRLEKLLYISPLHRVQVEPPFPHGSLCFRHYAGCCGRNLVSYASAVQSNADFEGCYAFTSLRCG